MRVLITAALPYANGPLHLGHIRSTYLPADICARFNRMIGNETIYVCATDEHGTPIVVSAEKEKKTPKQFVDFFHLKDKEEFAKLGFSMDIFHRTSSDENKEMTIHFFNKLNENGFLVKKEVEQYFCENCRRYLPDRFLVGKCPYCAAEGQYSDLCEKCGRALKSGEIIDPKCITCGTRPVKNKSNHYFFKLSAFSERLKKWLKENKELQKEVVNYVSNWIENGLADWDITRNLDWGVKIPGEEGLVFYVWFDAPIGYVSSTKALVKDKFDLWWRNEETKVIHFIGKDIVYHHFLFWPAMLMGTEDGFNLPDAIPVRGYLNLERDKFSKSKGWFVSLKEFLDKFEPDYLRYYETMITPHSTEDADFMWNEFQRKINDELVASIGNFIHRTLILVKKNGGIIKKGGIKEHEILGKINKAQEEVAGLMKKYEYKQALEKILALSIDFNRYLSAEEPWKQKDEKKVREVLYVCFRGVCALGILLYPFIPFSCEKLFDMLGIDRKKMVWGNACIELCEEELKLGEVKPLFRKIEDKEIEEQKKKLGKS